MGSCTWAVLTVICIQCYSCCSGHDSVLINDRTRLQLAVSEINQSERGSENFNKYFSGLMGFDKSIFIQFNVFGSKMRPYFAVKYRDYSIIAVDEFYGTDLSSLPILDD